jgi:hypothetical protein
MLRHAQAQGYPHFWLSELEALLQYRWVFGTRIVTALGSGVLVALATTALTSTPADATTSCGYAQQSVTATLSGDIVTT